MSEDDWRSEERYTGLGAYSPAELAWEFLRRNPAYQHDYHTWNEVGSAGTRCAQGAPWARWGLSFRRRSGLVGASPADPLAT